jgi:endonuclease YncB( thermonuclease family)
MRNKSRRLPNAIGAACLLLAALALLFVPAAVAKDLTGRVVGIADGDTLTLLTEQHEQIRIRLSDIDTPERRQPFGNRARQSLADLVFGKAARIAVRDTDRYGRTVGRVFIGTQDVNAEMVRRGAAWVYRRYSDDPELLQLEQLARAQKQGLWALPEAERIPPWEWRAAEHRR